MMGCDFFWDAWQPDIRKQKQCALFLQSIWEHMQWDYEIFTGEIWGHFLDDDSHAYVDDKWRMEEKDTLDLIGVSSSRYDKSGFDDDSSAVAQRQLSFVFNNSLWLAKEERGHLITYEEIKDFSLKKYEGHRPFYSSAPEVGRTAKYGIFRKGGYERFGVFDGAFNDARRFYCIAKKLFVPSLKVSDDYDLFINSEADFRERYPRNLTTSDEKREYLKNMLGEEFWHKIEELMNTRFKKIWGVELFE